MPPSFFLTFCPFSSPAWIDHFPCTEILFTANSTIVLYKQPYTVPPMLKGALLGRCNKQRSKLLTNLENMNLLYAGEVSASHVIILVEKTLSK